jgi:hypothetical protein
MGTMGQCLAAVAVLTVVVSCTGDTTEPRLSPASGEGDVPLELLSAARIQAPITQQELVMIGVPYAGRTATSAVVVYLTRDSRHSYAFQYRGGAWRRKHLVEVVRATSIHDSSETKTDGAGGYLSSIATFYDDVGTPFHNTVYINSLAVSGNYVVRSEFVTTLPMTAAFHNGTETHNDTTFVVAFSKWEWERVAPLTPTGSGSCTTATCTTAFVSGGSWRRANVVDALFSLTVIPPVIPSISGPTNIAFGGEYQWQAQASGGTGSYAYQWHVSYNNGASWTSAGAGGTLTMAVDTGTYNLQVRVTVTSGTKTGVAVHGVAVDARFNKLSLSSVTGPTSIEASGSYQWSASPSGGTGQYSYEWYYKTHMWYPKPQATSLCQTDWILISTDAVLSLYIDESEPDFYLSLRVLSGGQEASSGTAKIYPFEAEDPTCAERR